ncbi:MAG: AraC family transcriptional regulator [Acidobacteriota bacterium]
MGRRAPEPRGRSTLSAVQDLTRGDTRTGAFYGAPALEGDIGLFHVAERLYRPSQSIPRHVHARPYVCFVVEGRYRERDGRRTVECSPATLLVHPAGAAHSDRFEAGPARLLMLEMEAGWLERLDAPRYSETAVFSGGPVAVFGPRIRREAAFRDDVSPLALEGLVLELLAAAHREKNGGSTTRAPAWLRRTREHLEASFRRPPSLVELAASAGVHPGHLARTFRRHYRRSIGAFTREKRVEHAKTLIARIPLSDIALACGFADQSHFTRTFRLLEGVTPAEFRRTALR